MSVFGKVTDEAVDCGEWDSSIGEWDGVIPEPYSDLDRFSREFLGVYLSHLNSLITAIANDMNPDYDMNFQMKCDECEHGWCDVTYGFETAECQQGDNIRKDGFYVGKF